jgi:hypothetical protein
LNLAERIERIFLTFSLTRAYKKKNRKVDKNAFNTFALNLNAFFTMMSVFNIHSSVAALEWAARSSEALENAVFDRSRSGLTCTLSRPSYERKRCG